MLGACGPERTVEPTPLVETAPTPDLRTQAFKLTIDTRSGRVDVTPPAAGTTTLDASRLSLIDGPSLSRVGGPRRSLLGGDAIALSFTPCVFSAIPDRSKKRCTMTLAIANHLDATDLVTPTTFPRPPQGTNGILVFPFTAASVPGGEEVVPSPDWDLGPANFFNDNTCSGSGKTDCFRYEVFPSPLYAGEVTQARPVGFDIPATAEVVTVYLVAAADLRDNPVRTAMLTAVPQLCGTVDYGAVPPNVAIAGFYLAITSTKVGFCSFPNSLPAGARVRSASLRLFGWEHPVPSILVQRVNWGTSLEPSDLLVPTLQLVGPLVLEDPTYWDAIWKWFVARSARAGVQGAVNEQQAYIQFRIMFDPSVTEGSGIFAGTGSDPLTHPKLVVQYTQP